MDTQKPTRPGTAVIIISCGRHEDVIRCIDSLGASTQPPTAIFVVDNASPPVFASAIRDAHPHVEIFRNEENIGFVGACNGGLRDAMAAGPFEFYMLLNDDTLIDPPMIRELETACREDPAIGVAGPVIFPKEGDIPWCAGGAIDWTHGKPDQVPGRWPYSGTKRYEVDYVNGCAMMIPHTVLEDVGLFDERLFIYYEDTDFSLRVQATGRKLVVVPTATMRHLVSATTGRNSPFSIYYQTRNRLLFLRLHVPGWFRRTWLILRQSTSRMLRGINTYLRGRKAEGRAFIRGVLHYHLGRLGKSEEHSL
jgi:GT2 family glycosyltransferase